MARESVAQQVARAQSLTGQLAMRAFRSFGTQFSGRMIRRTPVLTGRARGNWRAKVGRAAPGSSADDTRDPGGSGTLAAIQAVFQGAQLGQRVYVTNSVPYIGVLEHGRQGSELTAKKRSDTRQKGHWMVRLTLAEAEQIGDLAVRQVNAGVQ